MTLAIRKATAADTDALFQICLVTADAGKSAEHIHDFPELPGLTYAVPYLTRKATWGFVLEEQDTKEVVGYVVGSYDTREYEQDVIQNWFSVHAIRYLYGSPLDKPDIKAGDKKYLERYRNPTVFKAHDSNIAFSPAHMHINLVEKHQKKGWGRKLVAAAVDFLKEKGLDGVWVAISSRNNESRKFYKRLGFKEIEGAPDREQLGLKFVDFN